MISPYYGELLTHPVPLELSPSTCSHRCRYCFVSLNSTTIKYAPVPLANLLAQKDERQTLAAALLRQGYPVLMSNRTDPLSQGVWPQAKAALEIMTDCGIKAAFQTKGGRPEDVDELLGIIDYPAAWYVTLTTLDEGRSRIFEPNAPSPGKRLAMIECLVAAGHEVTVGLNPCVRTWLDGNPEPLLDAVKNAGAWGVWVEALHFNTNQTRAMPDSVKSLFDGETFKWATRRSMGTDQSAFLDEVSDMVRAKGMEFFAHWNWRPSRFFEPYRRLYERTFPVMQDFHNEQAAKNEKKIINFNDFYESLTSVVDFPSGVHRVVEYPMAQNKSIFYSGMLKIKNATYNDLMKLYWQEPRLKKSPPNALDLAMLVDDRGGIMCDADSQMPFMFYDPGGGLPQAIDYSEIRGEVMEKWRLEAH